MNRFRRAALLAAATLPILSSCTSETTTATEIKSATVPSESIDVVVLEKAGIPNLSVHEDLYADGLICTGQLSEEQMVLLQEQGAKTFVSLRAATENGAGWEEDYAENNGVNFTRMEVSGAAGVTTESAKELDGLLKGAEGPVVLYCGSSNRVGTLVGLAAYTEGDMSKEEALELAESAGMTKLKPRFVEIVDM